MVSIPADAATLWVSSRRKYYGSDNPDVMVIASIDEGTLDMPLIAGNQSLTPEQQYAATENIAAISNVGPSIEGMWSFEQELHQGTLITTIPPSYSSNIVNYYTSKVEINPLANYYITAAREANGDFIYLQTEEGTFTKFTPQQFGNQTSIKYTDNGTEFYFYNKVPLNIDLTLYKYIYLTSRVSYYGTDFNWMVYPQITTAIKTSAKDFSIFVNQIREQQKYGSWIGKKAVCLGDSITWYGRNTGDSIADLLSQKNWRHFL